MNFVLEGCGVGNSVKYWRAILRAASIASVPLSGQFAALKTEAKMILT